MNKPNECSLSNEQLNAYIDDELDYEEKLQVFEQMEQNPQLSQEAKELRQLRAMLRHAYRTPPQPRPHKKISASQIGLRSLAASLLIICGGLIGWFGNQQITSPIQGVVTSTNTVQTANSIQAAENILLHLNSNDPNKMKVALDHAEQLLKSHRKQGKSLQLELLTNDGGVELLRRDTSPFMQRIQAMQQEYSNVSFLACATALQRLREKGIKVELIPGTQSEQNAIDKIIHRLEGGWRYLKV